MNQPDVFEAAKKVMDSLDLLINADTSNLEEKQQKDYFKIVKKAGALKFDLKEFEHITPVTQNEETGEYTSRFASQVAEKFRMKYQ